MLFFFFFFKQKTAYEMRISDWSSDVCSSDLASDGRGGRTHADYRREGAHDVARRVRGTPNAHRLLLYVVRRPARSEAMSGMQLVHIAGARIELPAFARRDLCDILPGPL